jgi:hypothetical protein
LLVAHKMNLVETKRVTPRQLDSKLLNSQF